MSAPCCDPESIQRKPSSAETRPTSDASRRSTSQSHGHDAANDAKYARCRRSRSAWSRPKASQPHGDDAVNDVKHGRSARSRRFSRWTGSHGYASRTSWRPPRRCTTTTTSTPCLAISPSYCPAPASRSIHLDQPWIRQRIAGSAAEH